MSESLEAAESSSKKLIYHLNPQPVTRNRLVRESVMFETQNFLPDERTMKNEKLKMK